MTATLWLRISAAIAFLFALGHSLGGLSQWSPMGDNPVLQAMRATRFDTMGANRSYYDFFMGFGWSIAITQFLQAILLWQLATIARTNPGVVRPLIAVFAVATAVGGVIAWRYIFPLPAAFSLLLLGSLVTAYVVAR